MLASLELSSQARTAMEEAAATYAAQLSEDALEYLVGRGLADAVDSARLGQVCDPLPGHEQYRGRLCIPFLSPNGVVALRFRALDDSKTKYLSMPGAQPRIYNVNALHTGSPVIAICEGEFDALALTLAGLPAVGVPGASSWQKHYPRVFADFARVFIITDNDVHEVTNEAGEKELAPNPGQRLAEQIAKQVRNSTVIVPPPNVDVSDWLLRDGALEVLTKIGVPELANAPATDVTLTQEDAADDLPPY